LTEAALATAQAMGPARRWRLLIGPNAPSARFEAWRAAAPGHAIVERARPDFRALLARAALSISQAGYNTVADILGAGVRSILVPFATPKETEQTLRAQRLMRKGIAYMLPEAELSAPALAAAIETVLAAPASKSSYKLDGAAESERLLRRWLMKRAGAA
jgi:predicted glycosyltransferase